MRIARMGDWVKIRVKANVGEPLGPQDSGEIEFRIGRGEVIRGLEQMVIGMKPNEEKSRRIPARDAFGERNPRLVVDIDRSRMPAEVDPRVGQMIQVHLSDGRDLPVLIEKVTDSKVTVDANHPLAGENLAFEVRLIEIRESAPDLDAEWLERLEN